MPRRETPSAWDDSQVRDFCREVRKTHGPHWDYIPVVLRDAVVAEMVLKVVLTSAIVTTSINPKDIRDLHQRMREHLFGDSESLKLTTQAKRPKA